eukprot:GFYU01014614.1.p1 GENE.GFYU01014614.1~~GFYU01014614.1.p1  ORF type:complete len:634 (+),score=157.37 GFYU01014614.1:165-2066(+)
MSGQDVIVEEDVPSCVPPPNQTSGNSDTSNPAVSKSSGRAVTMDQLEAKLSALRGGFEEICNRQSSDTPSKTPPQDSDAESLSSGSSPNKKSIKPAPLTSARRAVHTEDTVIGGSHHPASPMEETMELEMVECEDCSRRFRPDRLEIHRKTCKKVKPLRRSVSNVSMIPKPSPPRVFRRTSANDVPQVSNGDVLEKGAAVADSEATPVTSGSNTTVVYVPDPKPRPQAVGGWCSSGSGNLDTAPAVPHSERPIKPLKIDATDVPSVETETSERASANDAVGAAASDPSPAPAVSRLAEAKSTGLEFSPIPGYNRGMRLPASTETPTGTAAAVRKSAAAAPASDNVPADTKPRTRIGSGTKMLACDMCGRTFAPGPLISHKKTCKGTNKAAADDDSVQTPTTTPTPSRPSSTAASGVAYLRRSTSSIPTSRTPVTSRTAAGPKSGSTSATPATPTSVKRNTVTRASLNSLTGIATVGNAKRPSSTNAAAAGTGRPKSNSADRNGEVVATTMVIPVTKSIEVYMNHMSDDNIVGEIIVNLDSTMGDVRNMVLTELDQTSTVTMKRNGRVPMLKTQEHRPAYEFFKNNSDFIVLSPASPAPLKTVTPSSEFGEDCYSEDNFDAASSATASEIVELE